MALVACVNLALGGAITHTCQAVALINQPTKLPDGDAVISSSEILTTTSSNTTSQDRILFPGQQHKDITPEVGGGGDEPSDGSQAQTSRLLLQLLVLGLFVLVFSSLIIIYALKFCLCRRRKAERRLLARRARLIGDLSANSHAEMTIPALPVAGRPPYAQQFENFLLAECTCHLAGAQVPPLPAAVASTQEQEEAPSSLVLSLLARLQHSICASMHHHQTAPLASAVQPLALQPIEHQQQQQHHQLAQLLVAQLMAAAAACQSCGTCHEQWPPPPTPGSRPPAYADLFRAPPPGEERGGDNEDDYAESH